MIEDLEVPALKLSGRKVSASSHTCERAVLWTKTTCAHSGLRL